MRFKLTVSLVVAAMFALTSVAVAAGQGHGAGAGAGDRVQQMDRDRDFDRDRDMDRDRLHDQTQQDADQDRLRTQDRDRIHQVDPSTMSDAEIYGSALMSKEELNQYRKRLQAANSAEERLQVQAQHETQMQIRAKEQGKDLVPPGQGPVYGGELMTVQERNQYREQLRTLQSEEEMQQFMARHRERMNERAKALELEVEEAE